MSTSMEKHEYTFQAEIRQLLHLLSHSLYQSREIAVRELISNASDALDKMRHVALLQPEFRDDRPLEIRLETNAEAKELRIVDNGIGMTRDELVKNLGTIAHSGSLEFLRRGAAAAKEGEGKDADKQALSLIGQFGVGFYSAFMLADRVVVRSRSYQSSEGWEWESTGEGAFTVSPVEGLERGTQIVLHLKDENKQFAEPESVADVIRRYSTFVQYPIKQGDETLNEQRPIWVEPPSQLSDQQYEDFYQHLTHRSGEKPLWRLHLQIDTPIQFNALLYCPPTNVESLGFGRLEHGLQLCVKRILVQPDCRELLPEYLRFVRGIVDSEDLPLNVSRDALQDNNVFRRIRTAVTAQVVNKLTQLAEESPEEYREFYKQYSTMLKEGAATDLVNSAKLAKLLRFHSTRSDAADPQVSLSEYVARCPENQKQIYYLGGLELKSLRQNPNLEIFRRRNLEVLLTAEPIDEFVIASLRQFEGKPLVSIDAANVDIPAGAEAEPTPETSPAESSAAFGKVISLFREALQGQVADVRESKRLIDSPCCLVTAEGEMSAQMQKLMRMQNREYELSKRIFEVNPSAPLIRQLATLSANPQHDDFIRQCARQLFDNAQLLDGLLPEPHVMVSRIQEFLEETAKSKSPIILS